jgi:hypothetical protein
MRSCSDEGTGGAEVTGRDQRGGAENAENNEQEEGGEKKDVKTSLLAPRKARGSTSVCFSLPPVIDLLRVLRVLCVDLLITLCASQMTFQI